MLYAPFTIGFVVDDSCYSSDRFTIFICHIEYMLTHIKSRILFRVESSHFVQNQRWTKIFTITVKFISEFHKTEQVYSIGDFFDFYTHIL